MVAAEAVPDPYEPNLRARLEAACRLRLRARPHLLLERVALALCLSASQQPETALIEWDEAVYRAERLGDPELLEACLRLMGGHHPREALSILEALSVPLEPKAHARLRAMLRAEIEREAPGSLRERPPAYGQGPPSAPCDPGHQPGRDPLLSLIPERGVSCAHMGGTDGTEGQHGTLDPLALRVG